MNIQTGKKYFAALLCVIVIMVSFLSISFIAEYENHYCTDKDCAVCCQLEFAVHTIRQVALAFPSFTFLASLLIALGLFAPIFYSEIRSLSLVKLKIRMNH